MTEEPVLGFRKDALGTHGIGRLGDGKRVNIVLTERQVNSAPEPTLREVSEAMIAVYGMDFGIHSPVRLTRFTDRARQAAAYRDRRVLLAGDAAHVHPPLGGQVLNLGVQDAVNLGWKLAVVVKGTAPESLLDTYQPERHPIGGRVLHNKMAQIALRRQDDRTKALTEYVTRFLRTNDVRKQMAAELSAMDIHYDLGERHPLLGRRMPDLEVVTANGPVRVFTLLHEARPVLLNLGKPGSFEIAPWVERVKLIDAEYAGVCELPVLGVVDAPAAVLIRPDGHVAWARENSQQGLMEALTRWFGPPAA